MPTLRHLLLLGCFASLLLPSCQSDTSSHTEADSTETSAPVDTLPASTPRRSDALTWHRVEHPTQANAPLIRPGAGRRTVAPRDTAAPPPAEARLYDLTLKASEYHKIDPTQLAEVRGREGTVVRIPAGALVNSRGEPARGPVFVELKECYGLADRLLSNIVSETTDDQLMIPGGAVLVHVTGSGQPLHLAEGHTVQVELPAATRATAQLYHGRGGRRQPIRWVAAGPESVVDNQIYSEAQPMPMYESGPAALNKLVRYPTAAADSHTQGTVYVSAVIDEAGRVLTPKVLRGLGSAFDVEALRVLRQSSGRWTPGQREGRFVKVKMLVPIRFTLPDAPDLLASADSTSAPAPTTPEADAEIPATDRQAFRVGQLGWVAAARPRPAAESVTTLTATVEPDTHTSVRLVLHDAATIVLGQPTETGYEFVDVPANKKAALLGIRYMSGTPYVAVREITTGRHSNEPLSFRETTLAELEKLVQELE
ncbi:energy transducer TonB [Hymenobacter aerilatus]|uniref:Energy transducer TonB n=1 Tax=Hymenobacter aerilatus TaxID=2932251 RepID=A0A8T9SRK8_9BACT|nr:energy transducer TonB [Hymenobacter aerilatus]UOR04742.1 energy transducer TonB [Hymenobacter aerilatus]